MAAHPEHINNHILSCTWTEPLTQAACFFLFCLFSFSAHSSHTGLTKEKLRTLLLHHQLSVHTANFQIISIQKPQKIQPVSLLSVTSSYGLPGKESRCQLPSLRELLGNLQIWLTFLFKKSSHIWPLFHLWLSDVRGSSHACPFGSETRPPSCPAISSNQICCSKHFKAPPSHHCPYASTYSLFWRAFCCLLHSNYWVSSQITSFYRG